MARETYTISELAAEFGIKASAIRYYETMGLITPERSVGNRRIYTRRNRARLKLILRGKRFGATLDQIREMIGSADEAIGEAMQIERSLRHIELKREEIARHREELELFESDLASLKKNLLKRKREIESTA
ncbi:MAG: MerR family transcriptional regulator [Spirochaetes bacterium]|nr:MerR family transcriptional regulator [Spirochaetota bacterium]